MLSTTPAFPSSSTNNDDASPPTSQHLRLALCQFIVTADKASNIKKARAAIHSAADQGASLVILPEIWNSPYSNASFPTYAEEATDNFNSKDAPSLDMMRLVAQERNLTIVGGSIPERASSRLYNTCFVFNEHGLVGKYRKTHLFDIDIPGKITFRESDTLSPGLAPFTFCHQGFTIGLGICYDLRFPELALLYRKRGADVLIYPGAFNMTTGPLHWELLQRARAVDTQCYVATCSPARDVTSTGYVAYGHSMMVDPFATIVGRASDGEELVVMNVDRSVIAERRRNMLLMEQRRPDLYELIDKGCK